MADDKSKSEKAKQDPAKKPAVKKPEQKNAGGKVNVYSLDGNVSKQVELPNIFLTQFRPDIIRKAVNAARANRRAPYGPSPTAGIRHAVRQWGKGRGSARVQRLTQGAKAAESPCNVGGRRAHPPRPWRDWSEKINKKERSLALHSAVAAVSNRKIVSGRGHRLDEKVTLPLVLSNDFESLYDSIKENYEKKGERPAYTKETMKILKAVGLENELDRARNGMHVRAGRGKMRGRRVKSPKSILFVVKDVEKTKVCVGNIHGIEVVEPKKLSLELLAPGGDAGRLTVFTEDALKELGGE